MPDRDRDHKSEPDPRDRFRSERASSPGGRGHRSPPRARDAHRRSSPPSSRGDAAAAGGRLGGSNRKRSRSRSPPVRAAASARGDWRANHDDTRRARLSPDRTGRLQSQDARGHVDRSPPRRPLNDLRPAELPPPRPVDPASVPRSARYFAHDDRSSSYDDDRERRGGWRARSDADSNDRWGHDLFEAAQSGALPPRAPYQQAAGRGDFHSGDFRGNGRGDFRGDVRGGSGSSGRVSVKYRVDRELLQPPERDDRRRSDDRRPRSTIVRMPGGSDERQQPAAAAAVKPLVADYAAGDDDEAAAASAAAASDATAATESAAGDDADADMVADDPATLELDEDDDS
eukprot:TRINITY_DN760_c0_g1_i1.p1 TRINITY_DN760_c0_g1~~TRINITY_DN760_c0_g1_i1.p1  ORF type:complete len:344 (-),score=81.83 TRINITY_DN760_c0_g1_i1:246-1277(-)